MPQAQRTGEDTCLDRPCVVFLFPHFKTDTEFQDLVYHLDRETGVPLKVEAFKDEATRLAGNSSWIWQAESLDEVQGFHVPLSSSYQSFNKDKNAKDPIAISSKTKIESIYYNKSYSESQFWPVIQPGAVVHDIIAKSSTTIPDPKASTGPPAERPQAAGSIVATPPQGWMDYVPPVGLGLGLVLLITGLVLWRRRP